MTDATRRLIQNLRPALRQFTPEQLYELARGLGDTLAERNSDALLECRALECALLPGAQAFHRQRLFADWTEQDSEGGELGPGYFSRTAPGAPAPAETDRPASVARP